MALERLAVGSVLLLVLAFLASRRNAQTSDLHSILRSLLREESFQAVNKENRVAIGFGSCMDYFVNGIQAVEALNLQPPSSPHHHDVITSNKDLSEAFAFHFNHGGAAE